MPLELTFLGTGTSAGVPMIGCGCAVCTSDDPRDYRDRPSAMIRYPDPALKIDEKHATFNPKQIATRQFIIDASPEMRQQAMREKLSRIDGVMITHAHADHIFGTDDLRRFNATMQTAVDLYAEPSVIEHLKTMFRYIFEPQTNVNASFVANLIPSPVNPGQAFELYGATWTPLRLMHGRLPILGYRIDHGNASIAYCTDVSTIPPETYPLLEDLDVLVIDGLRPRHHPTHMTTDHAVEIIQRVGAKQGYLTHLAHDIPHAELSKMLPDHIEPAHDGLSVRLGQDDGTT